MAERLRHVVDDARWFEYDVPGYIRPHSRYGFAGRPGTHRITLGHHGQSQDFTMTIDADGFRVTPSAAPPRAGQPEVWIFGCSFTFGYAVDDAETLASVLQVRFPNIRVRNFAFPGWSTGASLVALSDALQHSAPDLAIFTYNTFHPERDVASPNRLRRMVPLDGFGDAMHLRAGLLENGEIYFLLVPLIRTQLEHLEAVDTSILLVDAYYANEVTLRLYQMARELIEARGGRLLVALQSGEESDFVFSALRNDGYGVTRIDVPWTPPYMVWPYDSHPNPQAHHMYADALTPFVEELAARRA